MHLYIMRHCEAENGIIDAQRPLTAQGRNMAQSLGEDLQRLEWKPSVILYSPFQRAIETAECVNRTLNLDMVCVPNLQPAGNVDLVLNDLAPMTGNPLCVSHLPLVENFCYALTGRSPLFQLGTLVHIQVHQLFGCQNIFKLVRPSISQAS